MATKKKRVNNKSTGRKSGAGTAHAAYNARPEQRKRRSELAVKRRRLIREGKLSVGDKRDISHAPNDSSKPFGKTKTKLEDRSTNRARKPKGFKGNTTGNRGKGKKKK